MLLNRLNIKSETVNNAVITIGSTDNSGKGKHFKSRFIQAGLVKIENHGIVLLRKETIDNSLKSMIGSPVIIKHQDVTNENANDLRCGVISDAYFNEEDGWYYAEGVIWDEEALGHIQNGWSVSCSYDFTEYDDTGGVENNIKYDKEFTKLNFTHLALVDNPRYERANIVFNSKVDNENKNHYPKGTPDGKGGQFAPKGYEKYFTDKTTGMSMYDDVLFDDHYAETKQRFPKLVEMSPDDYIEIVRQGFNKNYEKYGEKERVKTKEQLIASRKDKSLSNLRNIFGKVKLDMPMIAYDTREDGDIEMSSQEGLHRAILAKEQGIKNIPVAIYSTVRYGEKVSSELLKENLDYLTEGFKEIKKLNDIDNSKEKEMALLDELKKLISKVENEKGEPEMDEKEKVDNKKVDKRKLIDEVGGILKGKVDDEIIRTVMKKMEEASYNGSEDSKADNEKDEKTENCGSKVKNEDKDDKEKVEEIKEDVEKDVENKCGKKVENSKHEDYSSFDKINEIYNSVKQITESKQYESKQDRLDNAVEYFK